MTPAAKVQAEPKLTFFGPADSARFTAGSLERTPYDHAMDANPPLSINTRRFLLREYLMTDETDFINYQTDPEFTIHHSAEELGGDHARSVFQMFLAWQDESPRLNYQFAICRSADEDQLIGSCGIRINSHAPDEADFGMELARPYWGRHGFAVEISSAMINWAFSKPQIKALTADTALSNTVVARLAVRAGFDRMVAEEKQFWRLERKNWKLSKI